MARIRGAVALLSILVLICASAMAAARNPYGEPALDRDDRSGAATVPLRLPATGPAVRDPVHPSSRFNHPGILVGVRQLEFVRGRVNAGAQPWVEALAAMQRSPYASRAWQPKPRAVVECGGYSVPNVGCSDEATDAVAAYTHALLWYLTGDRIHAGKSAEILDAWSAVVRQHTRSNAPLQAGWSAASFVRAAEILRHTYDGWPAPAAARTATMFRAVYQPLVRAGAPQAGGNWELILLDAAIGIAVHLDDRAAFNQAVARFRLRVPAFIYLSADGPLPPGPTGRTGTWSSTVSLWYGQGRFVDGLTQETCRDFGHTAWGLTALTHVAETARLQGLDLYAEVRPRLAGALELHAGIELGEPVPPWLCGGAVKPGFRPVPEIAYSRLGVPLPKTKQLIESVRPERAAFFYGWETLTHAGNPF